MKRALRALFLAAALASCGGGGGSGPPDPPPQQNRAPVFTSAAAVSVAENATAAYQAGDYVGELFLIAPSG